MKESGVVNQRWELIRIFLIFALTGSSSVFVGRPFIKLLGVSKDNLHVSVYYALFIVISLVFYQILLLLWGWILGQFDFFWRFEKKMLKRLGLKNLLRTSNYFNLSPNNFLINLILEKLQIGSMVDFCLNRNSHYVQFQLQKKF